MKSVWLKSASVRKGGKPYFWFKQTDKYLLWVVWDRSEKLWKAEIENRKTGEKIRRFYGSDQQAKKAIDNNEDDWKAYI